MDMQFGVMLRGLFDWDDDMKVRFDELMEQARLIDRLGYDCITKGVTLFHLSASGNDTDTFFMPYYVRSTKRSSKRWYRVTSIT